MKDNSTRSDADVKISFKKKLHKASWSNLELSTVLWIFGHHRGGWNGAIKELRKCTCEKILNPDSCECKESQLRCNIDPESQECIDSKNDPCKIDPNGQECIESKDWCEVDPNSQGCQDCKNLDENAPLLYLVPPHWS